MSGHATLQDVESYPPGGLLTDGQHGADPFGTGSYGYDQSQVGILVRATFVV